MQTAMDYLEAIQHLKAEEQLHLMEASDYPSMASGDRSKVFQKYRKVMYNSNVYTSEQLEDLFKVKGLI